MDKRRSFTDRCRPWSPRSRTAKIDEPAFRALIDWQIASGSHGLVPVGRTGEGPTLSHGSTAAPSAFASTRRAAACRYRRRRVEQHARGGRLARTPRRRRRCGARATTPYYNKPTQEGLTSISTRSTTRSTFRHHSTTSRRAACRHVEETMKRLNELKNIVGIKDATGDVGRVSRQRHRSAIHPALGRGHDRARLHGGRRRRAAFGDRQRRARLVRRMMEVR